MNEASNSERLGVALINGEHKEYTRGYTRAEYTPWFKHAHNEEGPLLGEYVSDYMNREDVREAFNIPSEVQAWSECTSKVQYHESDEASIWIYPILKDKYRILEYSGDTDGAVPTEGTKDWIEGLNWGTKEAWRPWFTDGQVSGYTERYNGLDFVTVKGVGHMAPQWARKPVTTMITSWVHDEAF